MTLNYQLAEERGLSMDDIKDLEVLHKLMDKLVIEWEDNDHLHKFTGYRPMMRRQVRRLEYMMQDKWRFPRDKKRHGHRKRFDGL